MDPVVKIIYDNCTENPELKAGWGFSALIERGSKKILFDTGNDKEAFFSNLEKMEIDYRQITDVVFSHKHKDHTTGSKEILSLLNPHVKIYLPTGFPQKNIPKYLQVEMVEDIAEIDRGIFSIVLKGGLFLYEQSIVMETEKGLIIMTGCCHPGIIQTLQEVQKRSNRPIHLVLGGLHLFQKSQKFIRGIVKEMHSLQVMKVAPCHCSGSYALEEFEKTYGTNFYKIGTGSVLTKEEIYG